MGDAVTQDEITRWVNELCRRAGIRVQRFGDGTMGLVDVPAKYVAVIDAMHIALASIAGGEGLPEFAEAPRRGGVMRKARGRIDP